MKIKWLKIKMTPFTLKWNLWKLGLQTRNIIFICFLWNMSFLNAEFNYKLGNLKKKPSKLYSYPGEQDTPQLQKVILEERTTYTWWRTVREVAFQLFLKAPTICWDFHWFLVLNRRSFLVNVTYVHLLSNNVHWSKKALILVYCLWTV